MSSSSEKVTITAQPILPVYNDDALPDHEVTTEESGNLTIVDRCGIFLMVVLVELLVIVIFPR